MLSSNHTSHTPSITVPLLRLHDAKYGRFQLPSENDYRTLSDDNHALLKPAYESYCSNPPSSNDAAELPPLQLLPASDIDVKADRSNADNKITSFNVTKRSDPTAINFMGYYREENCLAFRGEVRLLKEFLDFANETISVRAIEGGIKAGKEARYPCPGLEMGLSYEDFAARVEIVEYVIIMDRGNRDESGMIFTIKFIAQALTSLAPNAAARHDSSPSHISSSPREFPPTPGISYSLSELLGLDPKESLPELDLTYSLQTCKTPPQVSDSSLSPPPEVIVTPPSMKRYSLRAQPQSAKYICDSSSEEEDVKKKGKRTAATRKKQRAR